MNLMLYYSELENLCVCVYVCVQNFQKIKWERKQNLFVFS